MATSSEGFTELGAVLEWFGYDKFVSGGETIVKVVGKVVDADEQRVKAADKVAKATAALSDQIERARVGYEGSRAAIFEYKAAQLGATDALGAQLAMLRELEEHTRQMNSGFKDRQQDLRNERGAQEDYAKDQIAQSKALQAERAHAAKMAAGLEADRVKDIQHAVAAENKARDEANARFVKGVQQSFGEYQKAKLESIKADEQVMIALRKANAEAEKLAEHQAIKEIEWANKSAKERIKILEQVQQYQNNPNISPQTVSNKFGDAAIRDLPQLSKLQADYTKEVHNTTKAHKEMEHGQRTIAELWEKVTFTTSRARSEMIVLAHEAVQGRFSRIPASMMVMAEYSNLSELAMTKMGVALLGAVGAVTTLVIAVAKGQIEFTRFNTALVSTGGFSGLTTSSLYSMASAITKTHGQVGEAKEALMLMAETGKFTREQITMIAPAIVDMAHVSTKSIEDLVKMFAKLADDPVRASKELNSQYHYLTGSVYEQIVALDKQGNRMAAVNLAEEEFAKASKQRATQIMEQLGWFEKGWFAVLRAISATKAAALSLGRQDTTDDQLKNLIADRDAMVKASTKGIGGVVVNPKEALAKVSMLNEQIRELQKQSRFQEFQAEEQASKKLLDLEDIRAQDKISMREKSNRSQLERRQADSADIISGMADRNAAALAAAGVKMYDIEQANQKKLLPSGANLGAQLDAAKERNDKIIALAKEKGVALVFTEERLQKDLRNIEEKKRDRPIQEVSFVGLDKFIQDKDREFQLASRHSDRILSTMSRQYVGEKKLADDAFAVARDNADTKNDIRLADIAVYTDYVQRIKDLNKSWLKEQQDTLDKEVAAGKVRTDAIIEQAKKQVALTEDGRARRAAVIKKAQDEQEALVNRRKDKMDSANEQSGYNNADAEAQVYRQATADVNRLIDATNKRLAQKEREYAAIGLSKKQIRELAELEDEQAAQKIKNAIVQEHIALDGANLNANEIKMYQERINKLEELYVKSLRFVQINKDLKARQEDWQAGMEEGWNEYMGTVDNVFDSTKKLTLQTFKGMEDALAGFVSTGKLNFSSLFAMIGTGLARLYIQSKVLGPIANALNGGSNGGGSGNSFGDGIFNSIGKGLGGLFGFGGGGGAGSAVAPMWNLGFGAFAEGGSPDIGKPYLVGENGPEWRVDRRPSTILPNGTNPQGMGQSINVVNNFILQNPADQRTQDQITVRVGESIQRALARNT